MEEGGVIGSGVIMRKTVSLQCTKKVEPDGSFGQVMEFLVGRLHKDILGARGHQETWIPQGEIIHYVHYCSIEKFS